MPQPSLPIYPDGVNHINENISFKCEKGKITYFNFLMGIFVHNQDDHASFRMITAQLYLNGNAKQSEIVEAFGVTSISVKRSVKKYKEEGIASFYINKKKARGREVLTPNVITEIELLLEKGLTANDIGKELAINPHTIRKGLYNGKIKKKTSTILIPDQPQLGKATALK